MCYANVINGGGELIRPANQVLDFVRRVLTGADEQVSTYWCGTSEIFRHRSPLPRHGRGAHQLVAWPDVAIVQVVKHNVAGHLQIERRIVQGTTRLVDQLIQQTPGHGGINTVFIERLNATFRQRVGALVRRTRAPARQPETLTAGRYVVGCIYNLCAWHHSLRLKLSVGEHGHHWVPRTPALAAGLTDHRWTVAELLTYRVPPSPWRPHRGRQGRWSLVTHPLIERWAT